MSPELELAWRQLYASRSLVELVDILRALPDGVDPDGRLVRALEEVIEKLSLKENEDETAS